MKTLSILSIALFSATSFSALATDTSACGDRDNAYDRVHSVQITLCEEGVIRASSDKKLNTKIKTNTADIANNSDRITEANQRITDVQETLYQEGVIRAKNDKVYYEATKRNLNEAKEELQAVDVDQQNQIDNIKTDQDINTQNIANNTSDIAANKMTNQATQQQADMNSQGIQQNRDAIQDNSQRLDFQQQQIDTLQGDLQDMNKELSGGIASTAAIAGLVQPRYTGDVNVSVGVGHYNGATSIALGVTANITDNVSIKVAAAADSNTNYNKPVITGSVGFSF